MVIFLLLGIALCVCLGLVTPISGRSGRFKAGAAPGTNYNFDDCNVVFSTTTGECTTFEDQDPATGRTAVNRADGNDDFKGTVSGPLDTTQMPGANFKQGSILTTVQIFLDKAVAARYCGSSRVICRQITYHPKQSEPVQRVTIELENAGGIITHPA